jgi:uncharacterized protein (TIGR00369 family)
MATVEQVWRLGLAWYSDRLRPDWRRKSLEEAEAIFAALGLSGHFWRLREPGKSEAPATLLERIRQIIAGRIPPPAVAKLVGFSVTAIEPGRATCVLQASVDKHANPMGTVHGGILCDLADAAMGMAYASKLAEGESFTTLELKINYLRPVWDGELTAQGQVVSQGQSVGLVECTVTDERGRLIARATSTCLTLRGEQARGR